MVNYDKYLTKDYEINFQLLYKDMSEIKGFRSKENRLELYNNVLNWFDESIEDSQNNTIIDNFND